MNTLEGHLNATGLRFGLIAGRFNEMITSKLVESATNCLLRHGAKTDDIHVAWVPGSFEIPLTALKMSEGDKFHALIALGSIIRGETPHFDYVCNETARGISSISLQSRIPIIFGVLTTDTVQQADGSHRSERRKQRT